MNDFDDDFRRSAQKAMEEDPSLRASYGTDAENYALERRKKARASFSYVRFAIGGGLGALAGFAQALAFDAGSPALDGSSLERIAVNLALGIPLFAILGIVVGVVQYLAANNRTILDVSLGAMAVYAVSAVI